MISEFHSSTEVKILLTVRFPMVLPSSMPTFLGDSALAKHPLNETTIEIIAKLFTRISGSSGKSTRSRKMQLR